MKKSSKVLVTILTIVALFYFAGPCAATEKATKDECIAKVEQAAKLIQEVGIEPAMEKLMDKSGPYKWKDSYVFCMNTDMGKVMAHPFTRIIGFPMKNWKDADGKQPFAKVFDEIGTKEKGWIAYNYQARSAETASEKHTYYLKVPGEQAVLAAGYYK